MDIAAHHAFVARLYDSFADAYEQHALMLPEDHIMRQTYLDQAADRRRRAAVSAQAALAEGYVEPPSDFPEVGQILTDVVAVPMPPSIAPARDDDPEGWFWKER